MDIILYRKNSEANRTVGVICISDELIGHTIEPPSVNDVVGGREPRLDAGVYGIEIRKNPIAGTPSIKVNGKNIPANTSIRCYASSSMRNPSITVVDDIANFDNIGYQSAWGKLLSKVAEAVKCKEEVKLIIK